MTLDAATLQDWRDVVRISDICGLDIPVRHIVVMGLVIGHAGIVRLGEYYARSVQYREK